MSDCKSDTTNHDGNIRRDGFSSVRRATLPAPYYDSLLTLFFSRINALLFWLSSTSLLSNASPETSASLKAFSRLFAYRLSK